MNFRTLSLTLVISGLSCLASAGAVTANTTFGTITYVASEGVYINLGTDTGLRAGDTLAVYRKGKQVSTVVITSIASRSAAAHSIDSSFIFQRGDQVALPTDVATVSVNRSSFTDSTATQPKQGKSAVSIIHGDISFQNDWHKDMTGSSLGYVRPGLRSRITVDNVFGTGTRLQFRHRSRLYHRSRSIRSEQPRNEWSNHVYELSLVSGGSDSKTEWGVGRVLAPYVRGIGFIDGGYMAYRLTPHYSIGFAIGGEPDRESSEPSLNRRKIGLFATYENGSATTSRLTLSGAISGQYYKDTLSREFIYLQTTYTRHERLSVYQSVEIDYNRSWRYRMQQNRLSFTNYFGRVTFILDRTASINLSYDARNRIRYYETRHLPDSLFDQNTNKGLRGSVALRLRDRVSLRTGAGVRFRGGLAGNSYNASIYLRIDRFPVSGHTVSIQLTWIESEFTTGYRSTIFYRFPVMRALTINASLAGYFYSSVSAVNNNYAVDVSSLYFFHSGLYLSGGYHQYLDSELFSAELYTELGVTF